MPLQSHAILSADQKLKTNTTSMCLNARNAFLPAVGWPVSSRASPRHLRTPVTFKLACKYGAPALSDIGSLPDKVPPDF